MTDALLLIVGLSVSLFGYCLATNYLGGRDWWMEYTKRQYQRTAFKLMTRKPATRAIAQRDGRLALLVGVVVILVALDDRRSNQWPLASSVRQFVPIALDALGRYSGLLHGAVIARNVCRTEPNHLYGLAGHYIGFRPVVARPLPPR